jgi:glutamine cyclotransferase
VALAVTSGVAAVLGVAAVRAPDVASRAKTPTPVFGYAILAVRPHDASAFTQGVYRDGELVESTGLNGQSSLRRVSLADGRVRKRVKVPARYFAEGATVLQNRVYQLTWLHQTGFVYDVRSFRRLRTFRYSGECWGLTNDGESLILSDGTDTLRFLDPVTFGVRRTLVVRDGTEPVTSLNELEVVRGRIRANVFPTDRIACVDPRSGRVQYWIDLNGLLPPALRRDEGAVLNGIAYDDKRDRLLVTGKLWPRLYQIKTRPK